MKPVAPLSNKPTQDIVTDASPAPDFISHRSPVQALRTLFTERKQKNPNYSLNAFSRDLGISASLLSRILNGSRALTLKQGLHIAAVLGMNQNETSLFTLGIVEQASKTAKISNQVREKIKTQTTFAENNIHHSSQNPLYVNYDIERFKAIAQWYHLPILNLTFTKDFEPTPSFISERLGISTIEAAEALTRLIELGLLEETKTGTLKKTKAHLYIKTQKSESAMRFFQKQMIEKAKDELNQTDDDSFQKRLINSITFACAPKHLELLKKKINEFQNEVLAITQSGPHEEIYQLNCQLIPLTKKIKMEKQK